MGKNVLTLMNAKMDVTYVVAIPDAPTHWEVTNVYVRVITPRLEINVSILQDSKECGR
jgi:hypothetical protein